MTIEPGSPPPQEAPSAELELEGPSPLPIFSAVTPSDAFADAEIQVGVADSSNAPRSARVQARLNVHTAAMRLGAFAPALEAMRQAFAMLPDDKQVQQRLAPLLARSSAHREAAEVWSALARGQRSPEHWTEAARCLAHAEAVHELEQLGVELLTTQTVGPSLLALSAELVRARPGHPALVRTLVECARRARLLGEKTLARGYALDAWIEAEGRVAGSLSAELCAEDGLPAGGFLVGVESAARALAAGDVELAVEALSSAAACARALEAPEEEAAALLAHSALRELGGAQDRLHDLLADAGRNAELALRMRAAARQERDPQRAAAAWRGIAAMETERDPGLAAQALTEAWVLEPEAEDHAEALRELATRYGARETVHDALCALASGPRGDAKVRQQARALLEHLEPTEQGVELVLVARMRSLPIDGAQDPAGALGALRAAYERSPGSAPPWATLLESLLPWVGANTDAAAMALRVALRAGPHERALDVLSTLASSAPEVTLRRKALLGLVERLDYSAEGRGRAASAALGLFDPALLDLEVASLLALLTAAGIDGAAARTVFSALATVAEDAATLAVASRLAGSQEGPFSLLAPLLDRGQGEPGAVEEQLASLRALSQRLGAANALQIREVRLALAGAVDTEERRGLVRGLARARPLSPEATLAWFGQANAAGSAEEVALAAEAVLGSLAAARDVTSVARAALVRLERAEDRPHALRLAAAVSASLGLGDRSLRHAVTELATEGAPETLELLESALLAASAASASGETLSLLRRIVALHAHAGHTVGERHALRRLLVLAPGELEMLVRLCDLLRSAGDMRGLSRVLTLRLALEREPERRRECLLLLASLQLRAGDQGGALVTLDRYVEEQPTPQRMSEAARAMLRAGMSVAAAERLQKWAEQSHDDALRGRLCYQAARLYLQDPQGTRASSVLPLLRRALQYDHENAAALLLAEETAERRRAIPDMTAIYRDLEELAAGMHGRRALRYRRGLFLEHVGEVGRALDEYLALFEEQPSNAALLSAIDRAASLAHRPEALLRMHLRRAEMASTGEAQVRALLDAAQITRRMGDEPQTLQLQLRAHDVRRDEDTALTVVETARVLRDRGEVPAWRAAVATLIERSLQVSRETWDEDARRHHALRSLRWAAQELGDPGRAREARNALLDAVGDREQTQKLLEEISRHPSVSPEVRGALRFSETGPAPVSPSAIPPAENNSPAAVPAAPAPTEAPRSSPPAAVAASAPTSVPAASATEDPEEPESADAECARLEQLLQDPQAPAQSAFEALLRLGALELEHRGRPLHARGLFERAHQVAPTDPRPLRALYQLAERMAEWDVASRWLEQAAAIAVEPGEVYALRLHRALLLEQRLDDRNSARVELEAVLEDDPSHRVALRALAELSMRSLRFEEAGQCYARAAASTAVKAEAADLLAAAGEAFLAGNDAVAGITQIDRAIDLDPRSRRAWKASVQLGRLRGDPARLERSYVSLASLTESDLERGELLLDAARAALAMGSRPRAEQHLETAEGLLPEGAAETVRAELAAAPAAPTAPVAPPRAPEPEAAPEAAPAPAHEEEAPLLLSRLVPRTEPTRVTSVLPEPPAPAAPPAPAEDRESVWPEPPAPPRRSSSSQNLKAPQMSASVLMPVSQFAAVRPSMPEGRPSLAPDPRSEDELRALIAQSRDDEARHVLAQRLARSETGRTEALRLERDRFLEQPTRLDALEAMIGLCQLLGRPSEARALRSVQAVLTGREMDSAPPSVTELPDAPPDAVVRMLMSDRGWGPVAEVGGLLWEAVGSSYRRELRSYGVTGVDRLNPAAPDPRARHFLAALRLLQLRDTQLFLREEVPGGALVARTAPPAVVLARPLLNDTPIGRYVLGYALEATRPGHLLVSTLDPEERALLAEALQRALGPNSSLAGASVAVLRRARELVTALTPRAQHRVTELLTELDRGGTPFGEEMWVRASETARARAGLLVSGDFASAARMVVNRWRGPGVRDLGQELPTLAPLRDLARFAVSEPYLLLRWSVTPAARPRR